MIGMAWTLDPSATSSFYFLAALTEWISSGLAQYHCVLSDRRQCATSNLMTHGWNFNYTLPFYRAPKLLSKVRQQFFLNGFERDLSEVEYLK